ncbi:MAG: LysR family transcriptional regulator [Candidatus Bathyarchaeia archaeon]
MSMRIYPKAKLWFVNEDGESVLGDGLVTLLEEVEKYRSISKASKKLDMSYRYALHRVSLAERRLRCVLIRRSRGGVAGGTSELTAQGKKLLIKYRNTEREIKKFLRSFSFAYRNKIQRYR